MVRNCSTFHFRFETFKFLDLTELERISMRIPLSAFGKRPVGHGADLWPPWQTILGSINQTIPVNVVHVYEGDWPKHHTLPSCPYWREVIHLQPLW